MKDELFDYYKLAIDARDKLNENYHKWMTFYYVANGTILVAVMRLLIDSNFLVICFLSIIGAIISLFWHLSCKGYYYWSNNWIDIIQAHERKLLKNREDELIGVYSIFSKKVDNEEKKNYRYGVKDYANVSTPKLTLIFSFLSIVVWIALGIIALGIIMFDKITNIDFSSPLFCKFILLTLLAQSLLLLIVIIIITAPLLCYYLIKKVKSKKSYKHKLVDLENIKQPTENHS